MLNEKKTSGSNDLSKTNEKDVQIMKNDKFFDILFDVINDSDCLALADLESDAQLHTITATLDDGSKFKIEIGICA